MVLAAVQWGMIGIAGRVAMVESVAPTTVAFWRATLGALAFALHASLTRAAPLRAGDRGRACGLGIGGVAVMYLAYLSAVESGGVALASILLYSAPLWVAVGGWLGWGDRPGWREALPLSLTLLGVVLVAVASNVPGTPLRLDARALGWGLLSGVTYALYYLMGRGLFAHNAPSRVLAWALGVGALALAPFASFAAVPVGNDSVRATTVMFGAMAATAWPRRAPPPSRRSNRSWLWRRHMPSGVSGSPRSVSWGPRW